MNKSTGWVRLRLVQEELILPWHVLRLAREEREGVLYVIASVSNDSMSRNAPAMGRNGTIGSTRNGCMMGENVLSLFLVKLLIA